MHSFSPCSPETTTAVHRQRRSTGRKVEQEKSSTCFCKIRPDMYIVLVFPSIFAVFLLQISDRLTCGN